ncbi:unnamed protein product [Rotaria sp. Silwood1]|nr:unnamed protein product [Rotaria sp. Silwood1]
MLINDRSQIENKPKTAEVVNYWYNLDIKGFERIRFQLNKTVSCLPANIELDGRSTSIRNFQTLLTDYANNTGSIRINDTVQGRITQYDI